MHVEGDEHEFGVVLAGTGPEGDQLPGLRHARQLGVLFSLFHQVVIVVVHGQGLLLGLQLVLV